MPGNTRITVKDIDGRWFTFDQQQNAESCTMASTKIVKEYFHSTVIGEQALLGIANMLEAGLGGTGVEALGTTAQNLHDWNAVPGYWELTLRVLRAQPLPIPGAYQATENKMALMRAATRTKPILIGWSWTSGGGHCTVCVGPTRTDPTLFVILDPEFGIQYLSTQDMVGTTMIYHPAATIEGRNSEGNTFIVTK